MLLFIIFLLPLGILDSFSNYVVSTHSLLIFSSDFLTEAYKAIVSSLTGINQSLQRLLRCMPQLLMCSFHHHSILVFSLDFSDLHIFPVCVFVSVSGFRGVFGSLGFCCCPCLFACCRSRFKGLTESLWGFPGYRNQFLLINSQAHLLFI